MESHQDTLTTSECPGPDVLAAYNLGRLTLGRLEAVAEHLSGCLRCQSSLLQLPPQEDSFIASLRRWGPGATEPVVSGDRQAAASAGDQTTVAETVARNADRLPALELFGKFRLQGLLGRGGMGVVFRALDTRLNRLVALKRIRDGVFASADALDRFRSEVEAAARLEHPHIVRIYEYGEQDGEPYCAMELMADSLHRRLAGQTLPEREAAELVARLAGGVAFAHGKGVIHRDLKPANVLLAADGTPKVADFGLAKLLDADAGHTQSEAALGTPAYMAPEQARGESRAAGPATDVYGLGTILYEVLTGQPPFRAATREALLERVRTHDPEPPARLRPGLSRVLDAICCKCLQKDPRRRYSSAQALADDLGRWLRGEPTEARPPGRVARIWRAVRRRPALMAALLLAVALVPVLWWLDPERPARAIEDKLVLGKAVTLIGETGWPAWSRWRLGGEKAKLSLAPDGTFSIHTWEMSLLELVRDPQQRHFRFRAEIRHERCDAPGGVGLYVCHEQLPVGPSGMYAFIGVSFDDVHSAASIRDRLPPELRGPPPRGDRVLLFARQFARLEREVWNKAVDGRNVPLFQAAGLAPKSWRTLTLEVRGDRVRGYWGEERGLVGELEIEKSSGLAAEAFEEFGASLEGASLPKTPHWFPVRGGLGLYVLKSSASFRRVTIEPLTDEAGARGELTR